MILPSLESAIRTQNMLFWFWKLIFFLFVCFVFSVDTIAFVFKITHITTSELEVADEAVS